MYLQIAQSLPRAGFVVTLHGSEIKQFCSLIHRRLLFRRLLGRAPRIGVVSNYVKDLLLSEFPELEPSTVLAPGAPRANSDSASLPGHCRSFSAPTVLLTVARIHPRKGQLAVLEALAKLPRDERNRIEYRIAGPVVRPRYMRDLLRFASRNDIRIRYLGCIDDDVLIQAYAEADIYVMTSVAYRRSVEGFGLGYLEASSHGLPVIAHRIGGVEDAVRRGETGVLVEPEDRDGLSRAIVKLVSDGSLRRSLGDAGRRWARSFSWQSTAHRLFDGLE
jgi:glycosyltransferase involved in cell wall biosynthesis